MPEHGAKLPKVFPQQLVSLLSCHGACRVFLARLEAMPPADIRMVLFRVPALKIAHTQNALSNSGNLKILASLAVSLSGSCADKVQPNERKQSSNNILYLIHGFVWKWTD